MGLPIPDNSDITTYRVCYADTDRMDRVYYANYLIMCERARTDLMRSAGMTYLQMEQQGHFLPVRRCDVRYHSYAVYDDLLQMKTWISRLRHATVEFVTLIYKNEQLIVTANVELACVSDKGTPKPFPEDIHIMLAKYCV